ncbi:MAG TPA: transcription-repair coupling factor [bacterium]|nr:transcription-repair coupling factor [bacterium]
MPDPIQKIRTAIRKSSGYAALRTSIDRHLHISGIQGSLAAFLFGELYTECQRPLLLITADRGNAEYLRDDLSVLYGEQRVGYFPHGEHHAGGHYFRATADEFRVDALEKMLSQNPPMLVAERDALDEPIMPRQAFEQQILTLQRGASCDFEGIIRQLLNSGYSRESAVVQPLEISVRGGILDVFPLGVENPIRLEFFGDELESIRTFSISSQRSLQKLERVQVPPALTTHEPTDHGETFLWDYLPKETIIVWHYYDEIFSENDPGESPPDSAGKQAFPSQAQTRFTQIYSFLVPSVSHKIDINFRSTSQSNLRGDLEIFRAELTEQLTEGYEAFICCENAEQVFRLKNVLDPHPNQHIFSQELSLGFVYPEAGLMVYTDHQIYSRYKRRQTFKKFAHEEIPQTVDHLSLGDYLVHQDYGIGIFRGLQKVRQRAGEYECIVIEYQDGDKVYVPLQKFHRVQKYQGTEGTTPRVHKLGSNRWERTKQKSKQAAEEVAEDLVELYGSRHTIEGHQFSNDTEYQLQMESAFLYEETEDQIQTTGEVKEDMESPFPMDRLLIGDVGFGKTEVALRAAFKSVMDSKQVAVLVPTTILSEQHYETFSQRLERFPIRVAALSRFRTYSEQTAILEALEAGELDVIIGTHRLLSRDVEFHDLGLVIVDEEHRFGVKHKEKLKQMTERVDVLSMTATPIPRTLQLSLSGARDLSRIETPPKERLPIYTEIVHLDDGFLTQVIMREMNRGGQVYFVHNRIQTISSIHKRLTTILPDLKFAVAHGRMKSDHLEQVMYDFLHRKYDVLISTAIIESGIDIPNVNTIIINRADQMGLAQLYQLRGRVGRANRRAYAYLLVPSTENMTHEARSRLQTLESFTHLGAGFQIAMKDLAMRGAGNLLGVKQSGFINSVGFDLYIDMINKSVQEKQLEHGLKTIPARETVDAEVNTAFDTYIPGDYVDDPDQRIDLYRRLSGATSLETIDDLAMEIEDRFGSLPSQTTNLLDSMRIKVLCNELGITRLSVGRERVKGQFIPDEKMHGLINYEEIVPTMLELSRDRFIPKFIPDEQLQFQLKFQSGRNQLALLKYYLMQLLDSVKFTNSQ